VSAVSGAAGMLIHPMAARAGDFPANDQLKKVMPTKGHSLHLGLNLVDPAHYGGWDGELTACEFDAKDMRALAQERGFAQSTLLLTPQATAAAVIAAISAAAAALNPGDLFLLTYSGHGGQVPDRNNETKAEPDRQDETWVLYDRQLIDDELWALWKKFKTGVRILVLSDSCHSGTVTKAMPAFLNAGPAAKNAPRVRLMPPARAAQVYRAHAKMYDAIQKKAGPAEKSTVKSSIILISGCQDNQLSLDGARNGLFTETLKKVWNKGQFNGPYRTFRDRIVNRMPSSQTPNYYTVGKANAVFEAQKPFTI
jgi:hypothetical protein